MLVGALNGALAAIATQGLIDLYNGKVSSLSTYRDEALIGAGIGAVSLGLSSYYRGATRITVEVAKPMLQEGVLLSEQIGQKAFSSTRQAREYVKSLGYDLPKNIELHHVVEQHADNIVKFGKDMIHNTENLVPLAKEVHSKITGMYNRSFRDFGTYRSFIKDLDFSKQYELGLQNIKNIFKN